MADLNNYFRTRRNQYQKDTIQRLYRANPIRSLINHREYAGADGENPTIVTYTHELPETYPFNATAAGSDLSGLVMEQIKRTNHEGTTNTNYIGENSTTTTDPNALLAGNPANTVNSPVGTGTIADVGNPTQYEIRRGQIERTFEIRQISFETADIALDDIKRSWQAAEAAGAFGRSLQEFIQVFFSDWYRVQNISMVTNKYIPTSGTAGTLEEDDYNQNFSNVTGDPTPSRLEWWHLEELYWDLVARGVADELAVGEVNGQPVLPLVCSPKVKNYLWRDESNLAQDLRWFDPGSRLAKFGYKGAIKGFIPVIDVFSMRAADATAVAAGTFVYPTQNEATSFGFRHKPRAAYKTATCEVATILPMDVYECVYEASTPTAFDGMEFDPQDYSGEFHFINTKTYKGDNDRGNRGYYLADIRIGAKPRNPDLGVSIMHSISGL